MTRDNAKRPVVRIGMLRLSDAAPIVAAKEYGFFAQRGLDVRISVEPSWANIADKLSYRQLDAAVTLPPLVFAVTLGLRGVGIPLIVPMQLSLNGLAVGVGKGVADELGMEGTPLEIGRRLADLLPPRRPRLRFAIAHAFSTHNLYLRHYLAAAGIDPDRDVELMVVPPADTVRAMQDGEIDGYCLGPPWADVATRIGVGRTIAPSSEIWRNHPEKCLAVRRDWAEANPAVLDDLLVAALRGARFCDDAANADGIAAILARDDYLAVERDTIRASLPGGGPGHSVFFAGAANFPWVSHAAWFLNRMARWGYLGQDVDRAALAAGVYRPDLFRAAAAKIGLSVPVVDAKIEGAHDAPWTLAGDRGGIPMDADLFCDGQPFDPTE
ncbi:MAG TPA: CmpA/NrtA family ABC transporter substrate-binding protein [Alphaproteobacteria bacterium]|jgi:NitT/TauT family transport system ATP-binding protein/nitrate/nitrite transport system substrate-binding protein|nr:CmpA/NrtA family ABC transporter substrate-binding protein [Alphaproteobacteria bacterium]